MSLPRFASHYSEDKFRPKRSQGIRAWTTPITRKWNSHSANRRSGLLKIAAAVLTLLAVGRLLLFTRSPVEPVVELNRVEFYDLSEYNGHTDGKDQGDRVLMCIPLRNAAPVIPMMISHLRNLSYPHELVDLAFLVSDTDDDTLADLRYLSHQADDLDRRTRKNVKDDDEEKAPYWGFNTMTIYEKDFGAIIGQGFDDRHGVKVQGVRRKLMGKARNWLLASALRPYHSWVYWRDADIETSPVTIIEDLMKHGRDVIVPNVWRPLPDWLGGEQPYDLNSWQESEAAVKLAETLDEDDVIVEGYQEYATWRPHLAYFRSANGNPDEIIDLDGIGGVSILARANVFRSGANFPGFAFMNHAETEAFGKMCRRMGFSVSGLVHYTVWHQYEPSEDDIKKMKEMEEDAAAIAAADVAAAKDPK